MFRSLQRPGFTLVEVLISIAIALLLVLGINEVFSIAQQTSGAGTVALVNVENARGAAKQIGSDLSGAVTSSDCAGLVIVSEATYAFRNKADMLADRDGQPFTINDPTNSTGSLRVSLAAANSRAHRIDRLMFFTRGLAPRETADAPTFASTTTGLESYVWYGHLALPNNYTYKPNYLGPFPGTLLPGNNNGDFRNPGDPGPSLSTALGFNPNNYFASDWILGRMPIVLVNTPTGETTTAGVPKNYAPDTGANPLSMRLMPGGGPACASLINQSAPGHYFASPINPYLPIYSSRYDMAFLSVDRYRQLMGLENNTSWWADLAGTDQIFRPLNQRPSEVRFEADPFPQRPPQPPQAPAPPSAKTLADWMTATSARSAPIFLRGCSQFIVEYAGDFLSQNPNNGVVTSAQPDGEIDYVLDYDPANNQYVKRVRWYGFPRDVSGPLGVPDGRINWQYDVVPLRDVIFNAPTITFVGPQRPAPFERSLLTNPPLIPFIPGVSADYAPVLNQNTLGAQYVCAWGWDTPQSPRPKMIRITIALDDPAGRLNNEQYFEYVFNLP